MNLEDAELFNIKTPHKAFKQCQRLGLPCEDHQSFWAASAVQVLRPYPSLSEISLEADIYRDGQLDMPSDKQAKVRLTWSKEQGRTQGKPSLTPRPIFI